MKITSFVILSFVIGQLSWAGGNEVGNGGDVVVCPDSVRLLDFVENDLLKKGSLEFPKADDPFLMSEKIIRRLSKLNGQLERQYNQVLSSIKKRIQFVDDAQFRDIKDSFEVAIPANCRLEQIAAQHEGSGQRTIHISKKLWDRMKTEDRAGLVLHEIVYEHFIFLGESNSVKARKFNAYLASKKILTATPSEYQKVVLELKLPLY